MKIKEWLQRILWFVSGVVVAGVLFVAFTSANKVEAGTNVDLLQEISQKVVLLEQRVKWLEDRNAAEDKANKTQKQPREQTENP